MPATGAVVTLLAGELLLWLLVRLLVRRVARGAILPAATAARVASAAVVGILLIAAGGFTAAPLYFQAAGVAALCTAIAIAVRLELSGITSGPGYALPWLTHRAPGSPGTITALGAATAAAVAFAAASMAYGARLLGPSDAALVALAAYLGMLLECGLEGSPAAGVLPAAIRSGLAAVVAAITAAALVVLLP